MTDALTHDAFLGGRLHLWQPSRGYRAGIDPVLLAASVPAQAGQSVLELGCGVGTAILCLGRRVPGLSLTGVERHGATAELARRNGQATLRVVEADLAALPVDLRQTQFDHVMANPPYFDRTASQSAPDAAREAAMGEETPLKQWIQIAAQRLRPKGYLHMIHRVERLPDLLSGLPDVMGSVEILPLSARMARAPERLILRARHSGRAPFRLHNPLILHDGIRHGEDGENYTAVLRAVLRDGAALEF